MKIGIVGAGAMGSVYGGLFASAGHETWLVDVWREHIEAIKSGGLRVSGASGDRTVRPHAATEPAMAGVCDLVVLATKMGDLEAAAQGAQPMIAPSTAVLAIQNGLGNAEIMERVLGGRDFLIGIAGGFGASIKAPGYVHHNGWEKVHIAEADGGPSKRLDDVVATWRGAGFSAHPYEDPNRMVWSKLICNCAYSAPCTVMSLRIGQVLASGPGRKVAEACATETYNVAHARGVSLGFDDPVSYIHEFGRTIPNAMPSMMLDMLARRRTEVDTLYEAVVREGDRLEVATPVLATMAALVRVLEAKHEDAGSARASSA